MAVLLGIPILVILMMVQSVLISQIRLLQGTADVVLLAIIAWALHERTTTGWHWAVIGGLLMTLTSALPLGLALISYLLAAGMALGLKRRIWQVPIMAMLVTTFFSTALIHVITAITLRILGTSINVVEAINLVALPSILLNLLFAIPVYALVQDLGNWLYPQEIEV